MNNERSVARGFARAVIAVSLCALLTGIGVDGAAAQPKPEGEMRWALYVTVAPAWLDPGEVQGFITPFWIQYALHDALVKPMPGNIMTPSLAESWTASKDGLNYDFVIRKNAKFHNGDPVTAEDVKFSFTRYKGGSAKLLKEKVKDVQAVAPNRVRFVLKEPWPDFMAFYGTSATGAGWIVPKKYVEKVGDDGFKKVPMGAGPYKFVSFQPGQELVLEAFPEYWRKAPSIKRLVMRSIPDESTRAAAVKTGEVDLAYLFTGPTAEDLKKTSGLRIVAPLLYGMYWLDFVDQWDPKSPWHDKRVRMAANLAIDRNAINQAEMLGLGKAAGSNVPPEFDFALKLEPPPYDPKRAKQLMTEAGYANGFDAGDLTPLPPYTTLAEAVGNYLQAIGVRSHVRTMERATFLGEWREKKLHGLFMTAVGNSGNAASRVTEFISSKGAYAYGGYPDIDDFVQQQAGERDVKKREALLFRIQQLTIDRAMFAPIMDLRALMGIGPKMADHTINLVPMTVWPSYEDMKIKNQ